MMAVLQVPNPVMQSTRPQQTSRPDQNNLKAGQVQPMAATAGAMPSTSLPGASGTTQKAQASDLTDSRLSIDTGSVSLAHTFTANRPAPPTSPISNPLSQASTSSQNVRSPSTAASSVNSDGEIQSTSPIKSAAAGVSAASATKPDPPTEDRAISRSPSVMSFDGTNRISGRARKPTTKALALADAGTRFYRSLQRSSDGVPQDEQLFQNDEKASLDEASAQTASAEIVPEVSIPQTEDVIVSSVEQSSPATMVRSSPRHRKPTAKAAAEMQSHSRKRMPSPNDGGRSSKIAKTAMNAPKEPSKLRKSLSNTGEDLANPEDTGALAEPIQTTLTEEPGVWEGTVTKDNSEQNPMVKTISSVEQDLSVPPTEISQPDAACPASAIDLKRSSIPPLAEERDDIGTNTIEKVDLPIPPAPRETDSSSYTLSCLSDSAMLLAFAKFAAAESASENDDDQGDQDADIELAADNGTPLSKDIMAKIAEMSSLFQRDRSPRGSNDEPTVTDTTILSRKRKLDPAHQSPARAAKRSRANADTGQQVQRQKTLPPRNNPTRLRSTRLASEKPMPESQLEPTQPPLSVATEQKTRHANPEENAQAKATDGSTQQSNSATGSVHQKITTLKIGKTAAAAFERSFKRGHSHDTESNKAPSVQKTKSPKKKTTTMKLSEGVPRTEAAKKPAVVSGGIMEPVPASGVVQNSEAQIGHTIHVKNRQSTGSPMPQTAKEKQTLQNVPITKSARNDDSRARSSMHRNGSNSGAEKDLATPSTKKPRTEDPKEATNPPVTKPPNPSTPSLKITLRLRATPNHNNSI